MLLVVRHGRTFAPGAPPVWIGAHEDPPLTAEGAAEARALGTALRPAAARLRRIDVSPMARTQEHAALVLKALGATVTAVCEPSLRELHYGRWAGRTRAEIVDSAGGTQALEAWEASGSYPPDAGFAPARETLLALLTAWLRRARANLNHAPGGWALAVTHGGILRLLAVLLQADAPPAALGTGTLGKVACGHGCLIDVSTTQPTVVAWNVPPGGEALQALYARGHGRTLAGHA